jgi:hypothetical protein
MYVINNREDAIWLADSMDVISNTCLVILLELQSQQNTYGS